MALSVFERLDYEDADLISGLIPYWIHNLIALIKGKKVRGGAYLVEAATGNVSLKDTPCFVPLQHSLEKLFSSFLFFSNFTHVYMCIYMLGLLMLCHSPLIPFKELLCVKLGA